MTDSKTIGAIGGIVAVIALLIVAVFAISNQPQYVIDRVLATGCGLTPGMVVNGTNVGIETAFPRGATVRMVLFGFTKTHGYACGLGRDGEGWLVHPESLTESS